MIYKNIILTFCVVLLCGCVSLNKDQMLSLRAENDRLLNEKYSLEQQLQNNSARYQDLLRQMAEGSNDLIYLQKLLDESLEEKALLLAELEQKDNKQDSLLRAKQELEARLQQEIADFQAKLEMTEKGLVVSFVAEILFDSGKSEVREGGYDTLRKVIETLNSPGILGSKVAVEGHTDNVPIRYSSWQSNWELASARALSVVHFFIDDGGVAPERLSGVSYGEYSPRESNNTERGRMQNRRVEIVILPNLSKY